jgi:predicted outer membrane repeat protein
MSAQLIQTTFPIFTDLDGTPLENGYIYIGTFGENPVDNSKQIPVYYDKESQEPVSQPIRTISGYPSRGGSPAQLYTNSKYSIVVQNSEQELVYSSLASLFPVIESDLPWYNALNYGNGTYTNDTIAAAVSDLGSSTKYALLISKGTWIIDANLIIPDNVHVIFENGALLSVATGVTVTINGTYEAPEVQIFSLTGAASISVSYLMPFVKGVHFGMVSSDSDNTYAVQNYNALVSAIASHETIQIGIGTYRIQGEVTTLNGQNLTGVSPLSSVLKFVATANDQAMFNLSGKSSVYITDMNLKATAHGYTGDIGIKFDSTCTDCNAWNVNYATLSKGLVDETSTFADTNFNFNPKIALTKWGSMSVRPTMQYKDATSVYFKGLDEISMCGFYHLGKYKKAYGRKFPMASSAEFASVSGNLEFESSVFSTQWYAVFAIADDNDSTPTLTIVPYIQVKNVSGSTITFNQGGELQRSLVTRTYNMNADALNGADCLVISETLDSRPNSWSGRVTTITDSTNSTATLSDVGTLAMFDYILPAPTSKKNYVWLGDFYYDSAEVRNFADGNGIVCSDSISLSSNHSFDGGAICSSQSFSAGGVQNFTIDGTNSVSGNWTGESGHLLTFGSTADDSARTATITGVVEGTGADTEAIAIGNTTNVVSTKRFSSITDITIDGNTVGSISVGISGQDAVTGQLPTSSPGVPVIWSGIISPLAMGIRFNIGRAISSTAVGEDVVNVCHDNSNHIIATSQIYKQDTSNLNWQPSNEICTFSFYQFSYIYGGGNLNVSSNTRTLHINGYKL